MILVLRAYFDESGTVLPSRVVTMGCLIARPERWGRFSRDWRRMLNDAGIRGEYKASHCITGKGAFAHLAPSERASLRQVLGYVIDTHVPYGFAVSIPLKDFTEAVAPYHDWLGIFRDAYPWLVRACLEQVAITPHRHKQKVACVFDEGPGHQDETFEHFKRIRDRHGWGGAFISITAARSEDFRPLQAADWLASEMRHDLDVKLFGTRKKHPGFSTIFRRMELELKRFDRAAIDKAAQPPAITGSEGA